MCQLVSEGLAGLGVVYVGTDADQPFAEMCEAVGAVAVPALDGEAGGFNLRLQRVPKRAGGVSREQSSLRRRGQRLSAGLADVPHVRDAVCDEPTSLRAGGTGDLRVRVG